MRLLVCGGAGFIGSTFVACACASTATQVTVLDKLTYAGRQENLREVESDIRFVHGAIEDPVAVAEAIAGCRGDRELRGRDARGPLDRRPRGVHRDQHAGHARAARGGAPARVCATCRFRPTRCTGRSRRARSPSPRRCSRRARTARPRPARTCSSRATSTPTGSRRVICRGSNNYGPHQYPEKLIPLMILNALAGDRLPVYGDGRNVRNWLFVEDFGRGIGHALAHGAARRGLQLRRAGRVRQPDRGPPDHRADRRRSRLDRVRDRPARARPALLALEREAPGAGLAGAGALRRRSGADRGVVSRERVVVGADPLGAPTASTTSATTGRRSRLDRRRASATSSAR